MLKPRHYRVAEYLIDAVLPRLRLFLWPFYFLTKAGAAFSFLMWFASNEVLKARFGACGRGVRIWGRQFITSPDKVSIGDNVHINRNTYIRAEGGLLIGDNVQIASNLTIYTMNHDYEGQCLPYDEKTVLKPVVVGSNVWIGMNVTIAPGVSIGDGAIIGMGAVIAKNVAPLSIVGSAGQRVLKMRDPEHYQALVKNARFGGMSGYLLQNDQSGKGGGAG